MGHTKLTLKCDNEPAVKQLVEYTLEKLRMDVKDLETITKEHPERYESQSNGMVEAGIRIPRGHYLTLKGGRTRRRRTDAMDARPRTPFSSATYWIR